MGLIAVGFGFMSGVLATISGYWLWTQDGWSAADCGLVAVIALCVAVTLAVMEREK